VGNLTSQFFANIYLNQLDHYIKQSLGYPAPKLGQRESGFTAQ
jgi:hypothetical protein